MGENRRPGRYPRDRRSDRQQQSPRRTAGQQARLWLLSLCGAVPGAIVVYLTDSFLKGASVFLCVVIVLGFVLYLFEKRKQR